MSNERKYIVVPLFLAAVAAAAAAAGTAAAAAAATAALSLFTAGVPRLV